VAKLLWGFPDFLWSLVALANLMRLSLLKAAHAKLFGAACRKSGSPVFFGPGTPPRQAGAGWRTWGSRPFPSDLATTQTPAGRSSLMHLRKFKKPVPQGLKAIELGGLMSGLKPGPTLQRVFPQL
jgi:hypothetical protein